jgi:hypothetical protein
MVESYSKIFEAHHIHGCINHSNLFNQSKRGGDSFPVFVEQVFELIMLKNGNQRD